MSKPISFFRAFYRLLGLGVYTTGWIIGFYFVKHPSRDPIVAGLLWRRKWLGFMLPFLGVKVHERGLNQTYPQPVIYIGNHRSYIDPVVAAKYAESIVVSKSEVANWPLIGKGIQITGVVFVRRDNKESRSGTLIAMEKLLKAGVSVMVFPEGTTSREPGLLPFRPRTFELAAQLGIPIVPMAIEYINPDDSWTGDDTFIPHFFQTFGRRTTEMHLTMGPVLRHTDGTELMQMTRDWIAKELTSLNQWVQRRS